MGDKIAEWIGVLFWVAVIGVTGYSILTPSSSASDATSSSVNSIKNVSTESSTPSSAPSYDDNNYDYSEYDDSDAGSYEYDSYEYNPDYNASTDLDCSDFGYSHYVGSNDPHGLDGDGDGYACESY